MNNTGFADTDIANAKIGNAWSQIAVTTHKSHQAFIKNCTAANSCQRNLLLDVIKSNTETSVGKLYHFKDILNDANPVQRFRKNVPPGTYDDLSARLSSQMAGNNALLASDILFYERTGGSSVGVKYIPYTAESLNLLHHAVNPWLHDLITSRPNLKQGAAYWSISPTLHSTEYTSDGTRLGGNSDIEFLPQPIRQPFTATMTDPTLIAMATDYADWQRRTLLTLALYKNLTLISIWSPAFLTTLLQTFDTHREWIFAALENPAEYGLTQSKLLADKNHNLETVNRLHAASAGNSGNIDCRILWPVLDTISCWTHGPSTGPADKLSTWFPETHIQPKGLLATEGAISITLDDAEYPVLAINSGFFEFTDSQGQSLLAEELRTDCYYRVLITNASGLYRYDIGDQIRMRGWLHNAPMIEFAGRSSNTSDLYGEKLEEAFINQCIIDCQKDHRLTAMLVPQDNHYCLLAEDIGSLNTEKLAIELDHFLCRNPQYKYARDLGQLRPVTCKVVTNLGSHYLEWRNTKGQTIGDIKPAALCTDPAFIDHLGSIAV